VSLQQERDALTARIAANENVPRRVRRAVDDHNGASVSLSLLLARGNHLGFPSLIDADGQVAADFLPGARAQPNPDFKDL
jgi:hypothetical protein